MIGKNRCAIVIILIFLSTIYNGYTQQSADTTLSLKQCVDIAVANNIQVKQSELQMKTDYLTLKQAKDNRLPEISANASHGINQGRSIDPFTNNYINQNVGYGNYSLSGGLNLFNGGSIRNGIKQNRFGFEASRMDLQQEKEAVTINIILAYLQVLNNEDLLQQSKNQFTLTQKQVERLEILNKEGSIIPAQLYELKGQLASDELAIVNNQNSLDAATLALCQLMNIPYKRLRLEKIYSEQIARSPEGDPASIYRSALAKFPSVKAAAFRRQSGEAAIKAAKGEFYPLIGVGGGLNTNYSNAARNETFVNTVQEPSGDYVDFGGTKVPVITNRTKFNSEKIKYIDQFKNNYSTSVSVFVRIPLLNYNQVRNRVALARVQYKNAEYLEQTARTQLSQNIEKANFDMTAAYKKHTVLQKQVSDFEEAFKIAEVRFNEGASNQVEYLIAKNNSDNAKINLIIARYDYILRTKILDYYQGKLVL